MLLYAPGGVLSFCSEIETVVRWIEPANPDGSAQAKNMPLGVAPASSGRSFGNAVVPRCVVVIHTVSISLDEVKPPFCPF